MIVKKKDKFTYKFVDDTKRVITKQEVLGELLDDEARADIVWNALFEEERFELLTGRRETRRHEEYDDEYTEHKQNKMCWSAEKIFFDKLYQEDFRAIVNEDLTFKQETVISEYFFQGLSTKEIALKMGRTTRAIQYIRKTALGRLLENEKLFKLF